MPTEPAVDRKELPRISPRLFRRTGASLLFVELFDHDLIYSDDLKQKRDIDRWLQDTSASQQTQSSVSIGLPSAKSLQDSKKSSLTI
jgi:hypothetical protein